MVVWSAEDPDYPRVAAGGIKPTNLSKELQFFEKVSRRTHLRTPIRPCMCLCKSVQLSVQQVWHELLYTAFPLQGPVNSFTTTLSQQQCTFGSPIRFCILKAAVWYR